MRGLFPLQRFDDDAQSGVIRCDGVPIDEWDLRQLRRQMAVVAQVTQLFATTIIENITYGMKPHEYTREEVIEAAKAAIGTQTSPLLSYPSQLCKAHLLFCWACCIDSGQCGATVRFTAVLALHDVLYCVLLAWRIESRVEQHVLMYHSVSLTVSDLSNDEVNER